MRFYSETLIERFRDVESWGYFYEAKDLTKHPFLDRYRTELVKSAERDRTFLYTARYHVNNTAILDKAEDDVEKYYPIAIAETFENAIKERLRVGFPQADMQEALDESNIKEHDIHRYFKWVILKYVKYGTFQLEDITGVALDLITLEIAKRRRIEGVETDINRYKHHGELADKMAIVRLTIRKSKVLPTIDELLDSGELKIHHEDSKIVVYTLHSPAACEATGSNQWCTTSWAFERYSKDGQLYTVHVKNNSKEMYHLHFELLEFEDQNKNPIPEWAVDEYNFDRVFPGSIFDYKQREKRVDAMLDNLSVVNSIGWHMEEMKEVLTKKPSLLGELEEILVHNEHGNHEDIPSEIIEHVLKIDPNHVFDLEYISEWMQEVIVRHDPELLQRLYEDSVYVGDVAQEIAVDEKPDIISYSGVRLKPRYQKMAVDADPELLSHADREIQKEYITSDPEMIQYLDTPDEELQMLAIRMSDDPDIIKLFKNKVLFSAQAEWDYKWGDE